MSWDKVGEWLKGNAGTGAALVGSLLTGNVPGAIASGVALVSSATGSNDPVKVLESLQSNPETLLKLKELAFKEEDSIREHLREIKKAELDDQQKSHAETQQTIRSGDNAEDIVVRRTRPFQSWLSLCAAIIYVFISKEPDVYILSALLMLPFSYAGLRGFDKGSFGTVFKK